MKKLWLFTIPFYLVLLSPLWLVRGVQSLMGKEWYNLPMNKYTEWLYLWFDKIENIFEK